ncbi:MAG: hypothetical protein E6J41_33620, partial [Chloroflexi bacterium]
MGGANSLEDRLAELAVGLLAALLGAAVLLWLTGELAGLISHRAWPPVGIGDAPAVAIGMLRHPRDPSAGWPSAAQPLAPPAWLYYGVLFAILAGLLAAAVAIASRVIGASADHRAAAHVPAGLRRQPGTRRLQHPFLAWSASGLTSSFLTASPEDCVAVVGPPRVGKTQGVLVPQVLLWDGAVVSASTKPDVIEATVDNRRALAAAHAGRVMVWA